MSKLSASFPGGAVAFSHWLYTLQIIADIEIAKPTGVGGMGGFAIKQLCVTFASFGQFVLPALFGLGVVVSIIKGTNRKRKFEEVKTNPNQDSLFDMTWQQFEVLVNEFFRRRGYVVKQTGGNGPDGGVDLIASKGTDRYFVQCKQWRAQKVGVQTVRELYGVTSDPLFLCFPSALIDRLSVEPALF